jgi:hypothetical protein
VIEHILAYLDLDGLLCMTTVWTVIHDCCYSDALWRRHFSKEFGTTAIELSKKPGDATSVYQLVRQPCLYTPDPVCLVSNACMQLGLTVRKEAVSCLVSIGTPACNLGGAARGWLRWGWWPQHADAGAAASRRFRSRITWSTVPISPLCALLRRSRGIDGQWIISIVAASRFVALH